MKRDSFIYKSRRKLQVIAHYFVSDKFLSKVYFRIMLHKNLDLDNPQTLNEKLQWLKLNEYPHNALIIECTDKYVVKEYIKKKGYENILVPLIDVWDKPEGISWDSLPNQFVLKCNHGCAYNIICADKKNFDIKKAEKNLKSWIKEDFGKFNIEPHYSMIKNRKIICEEYLGEKITDYKFFCFNGRTKFIYVSTDLYHDQVAQIGFFTLEGDQMPFSRKDYDLIEKIKLPPFFEKMKRAAEDLCKDFTFVRVDFFLANNTFYFAELTFTPNACMMPFNPDKYDLELGKLLEIEIGD